MMKRKCPYCGSTDVAEILRGMPVMSDEMVKAIEEKKIILGGCCISEDDPKAHCNACGKKFGKPPYVKRRKGQDGEEPREQIPDVLRGISFYEGGYFSGIDLLEITSEGEQYIAKYSHFDGYPEQAIQYISTITNTEWERLKKSLFERLYIHEWKRRYDNPDIMDGTQWELTLHLTEGREITTSGSNEFPPLYKGLVRKFKKYMKRKNNSIPVIFLP